jgi:HSP20 family molecular chaperone IbpA
MQVLVEYNKLIVYATLPPAEENSQAQQVASFPLFSQVIPIPFHVAVDQIEAVYQDGRLKINLPFANDRLNQRQAIQIRKI